MTGLRTARKLLAGVLLCVLAAACGSGGAPSPVSPSARVNLVSSVAGAIVTQIRGASIFGLGVVDVAACLQSSQDAACFSASRMRISAAGAASVAPGSPVNLTATVSAASVTLVWNAAASGDPAISYVVEAGSSSGAANLANVLTNSIATALVANGVGAGTYFVRVRAQNAAGISAASNEVIVVVGGGACTSPPGAPSGLASAVSGDTVTLTWSAPSGGCAPTSYVLEAGSAAGLVNLANANSGSTATTFFASGVGAGTYYVRLRAANAVGVSGPSNEVVVTVGGSSGPNVSGRWVGLAPDGVSFINVPPLSDTLCDTADDLQLDLTQVGTALSGTVTLRTRTARTPPACSGETIGVQATALTDGTTDGTVISFKFGSGRKSLIFSGSVAGNRMSGVVILGGDGGQAGPFTATRQ